MVIRISSPNEKLLDILYKNPSTDGGLYLKELKNGVIVGNAIDNNHYDVVFQDTKYSYLPEDSNQIDFQSYCNPLLVVHICNDLFGHILKSRKEYSERNINWLNRTQGEIDTQSCTIEVSGFYIHSNWNKDGKFLLAKYFDGITIEPVQGRVFKLTIKEKTVFDALNLLSLVAVFTHITNEYGIFLYIDDHFAIKYARILTNLEKVPYFVFYLFIKRAIKSERQFKDIAPMFSEYFAKMGRSAEFSYYDNYQDRIRFILDQIREEFAVMDIGCGELKYYNQLMRKGFKSNYYAVDKDEDYKTLSESLSNKFEADNLHFFTSVDECTPSEKVTILLTEVIEHNTLEDAKLLIGKALSLDYNKIIITTPNVEFNTFYEIEELRHDDHNFELTRNEFRDLIESSTEGMKVTCEFFHLGDKIDGVQPTQAVVITQQNN